MGSERNDAIGQRGESIFTAVMLSFHGRMPLFRVQFLGDKWPGVDFICELRGPWKTRQPFFFVQVKSTAQGYAKTSGRLKARISKKHALALSRYPAPVYLAGVDERNELVYMVAATGRIKALSSMDVGSPLDGPGRRALYDEVRRYWAQLPKPSPWTGFVESEWK